MHILVTGGAGYIGSHTVLELLRSGHTVTVVDNFSNSSPESLRRVERITGKTALCVEADLRDRAAMEAVFEKEHFDCVIHFAGLKAVGESVLKPWEYYDNNIVGTLVLTDVMRRHGCKNIIFSSSATVTAGTDAVCLTEDFPRGACSNPYSWTKSMLEQILTDLNTADVKAGDPNPWNVVLLRYFNPIGADPSGLMGEDPNGVPNNLMPYITQVAMGKLPVLHIFGNDYPTPDGTCIRDYVHVSDLASGHAAALRAVAENRGVCVYNLGTGHGTSVLEIVAAFEKASGMKLPCVIDGRRAGDLPEYYADVSKAERELGWKAQYTIEDMCRDSWNWQKNNPNGYGR